MLNAIQNPDGSENVWTAFSHSGKERNRLFLNDGGKGFIDVSGVSGADGILDGRCFVVPDFNRDGRADLVVVNANKRLLQFYENRGQSMNHFVAIRLQGSAGEKSGGSNRDAIGARVVLTAGDQRIMRVLSGGEGFASLNGRTLLIGIGKARKAERVEIFWPSGDVTSVGEIDHGGLVSVEEKNGAVIRKKYAED